MKAQMNIDVFALPVHPAAEIFPMLSDDELNDLAADIRENGLNNPLVVGEIGGVMTLIDGRNRREACRRAKVTPEVKMLNGEPEALILSENILRRHMTKGQRAMAVAMMYPSASATNGRKSSSLIFKEVTGGYLSQARSVLTYAPELARSVLAGDPLNTAYEEAKRRKEKAESKEVRLDQLKSRSPDLFDLVVEERMSLEEAEAAYAERERLAASRRAALAKTMRELSAINSMLSSEINRKAVIGMVTEYADEYRKAAMQDVGEFMEAIDGVLSGIESLKNELGGM